MRNDLTDITVILDRSDSMQACKTDAEGGLNHFIQEQKQLPGEAIFTLVQFDTEYECVHRALPIRDVPACTLEPRGSTALLDAVGRTIEETGKRLAATPEQERPGLVVMVIVTDGEENASHTFTLDRVKAMIDHQQSVYKWRFTYLGANQDSFAAAGGIGIAANDAADFQYGTTRAMYTAVTNRLCRMRAASQRGESVSEIMFTPEERREMKGD
jgi:hypothetical protein